MNTTDLVEKVAQDPGMPKAEASRAVEVLVQTIIEAAKAGEEVRVTGLGIFDVVTRDARPGQNPQTGESIDIPASTSRHPFCCDIAGQLATLYGTVGQSRILQYQRLGVLSCSPFQAAGTETPCLSSKLFSMAATEQGRGHDHETTVDHALMRGLVTAGPVMRRGASSV
jgi:DNA-binding protein HU-beta